MGRFGREDEEMDRRARRLAEGEAAPTSRKLLSNLREGSLGSPSHGAASGTFKTRQRLKPLVLFVDDSAIATLKMLELLRSYGYDVATTSNGASAIRMARELSPNLILMDVEMPEMNGTTACAELKRDPRTASIPVVLMTAHDDPRHLRDGFRSGCDGYISKGTGDAEILRKISLKLLPGTSLQTR